jgi:hypothetical protein
MRATALTPATTVPTLATPAPARWATRLTRTSTTAGLRETRRSQPRDHRGTQDFRCSPCLIRHLAQKFQPSYEGPFSVITQKSHNNYLLQDCVKANRTRSVHVNLIKHGTFREQLYDKTVYAPLTDLEPPQQQAALLRTLKKLKSTQAQHAHGQLYDDSEALLLRDPALQKETGLRVESTSESDNNKFENALDRTIIQSSDENETPPTRTPPPSPLRPRRRPSPTPSPASGATRARPRTRNQTNKDGEKLSKLHGQPFPRERKKKKEQVDRRNENCSWAM